MISNFQNNPLIHVVVGTKHQPWRVIFCPTPATAKRIKNFLATKTHLKIEEKKMFRGLTFMVNGKMCVSVSNDNLMCRFDPSLQKDIEKRKGFQPMIMKGKEYKGYCYINSDGLKTKKDFEFWANLCLDFNDKAKSSKK